MIPLVFFALTAGIYAQEDNYKEGEDQDDIINIESDWASANFGIYKKGDQTFSINIGLVIPLFYADEQNGYLDPNMNLGAIGALGYTYFLDSHFFLGGELSGMFCATEGNNMYFIIPIGFRAGYQFVLKRFEFILDFFPSFQVLSILDLIRNGHSDLVPIFGGFPNGREKKELATTAMSIFTGFSGNLTLASDTIFKESE